MKRIISIVLAVLLLAGCSSTAFAKGIDITKGFDGIVEAAEDLSWGGAARILAEITGFEDVYHVISPNGEAVSLKTGPLSDKITKILNGSSKYRLEYQWYTYDCAKKCVKPIDGAVGTVMKTSPMATPGMSFYFYKVVVYQKILFSYLPVSSSYSIPYVVSYSGLPTVYVNTPDSRRIMSDEEWIEDADIQIIGGPDCDYNLDPTPIRIKGRGNLSWRSSSKNAYTIKFDKKQDIFGIGKDKTWALVANFCDKSLLRNWFAAGLDKNVFDDGSEWNVTQRHVDLVINGEYRGNYTVATTIRIGDNRVDIPDISEEITKDRNKDGVIDFYDAGFVVEIDDSLDEIYNFQTTKAGVPICLSDPDLDEYSDNNEAIYQHIKGVVQNAEDILYSDSFTDPDNGYSKYIDVDSFIDHYLIQELSKNRDGHFNRSVFIYYQPKDGKLHVASSWDFDIAFGNNKAGDCDLTYGLCCNKGWYARMFQDPAFVEKLVTRWNEAKPMVESFIANELQQQADVIRVSAALNFMKWPILGLYVERCPRDFYTRWTYQAEVDYLTNWTLERVQWLDGAFNALLK